MLLKRKRIIDAMNVENEEKSKPAEKMVEEGNPDFIPFGGVKDDKFVESEKELKLTREFIENNKNRIDYIRNRIFFFFSLFFNTKSLFILFIL